MPSTHASMWAEVGQLVISPEQRQMVARLEEGGVVRISDGMVSLAQGIVPDQAMREDLLNFLQEARIEFKGSSSAVKEEVFGKKGERACSLLDDAMSGKSLAEIYQHIPSPPPIEAPQPEGVVTEMFRYQLRTLNRMLEREQTPQIVESERWIPIRTDNNGHLHLNPNTLEIRPTVSKTRQAPDARGGVLSEEMGVGKTLEILSLILSTRSLLPSSGKEEIASSVTTELALDWPQEEWHGLDPIPKDCLALEQIPYYSPHVEEQGRPYRGGQGLQNPPAEPVRKLPSLKNMCAHVIRLSGLSISPEQYQGEDAQVHIRAIEPLLKSATPFYHLWPPLRGYRTPRVEVKRVPVKIYLSAATLVIVPGTLLAQWQAEIAKHIKKESLRVLYLPRANSIIPPALDLANEYDLILLSHARLGKEDKEGALKWNWPSVPRQCQCPYLGSTRTVNCHCPPVNEYQPSDQMSPLLRCKFKRLCVDEGHVAAGDSDMVRMACKIRSECRWVISGTPTESLVGSNLFRRSSSSLPERREVTNVERRDLEKLRAMLSDFLNIPLLDNWHAEYESPFKKSAFYSSTRLWKLLSRVMVRNQPQDVEKNSPLPPLKDEIIRLDFTRLERATFNVLQSLILLNAIWSQREDDDYFFHYSNRKHLAVIMENLSLSCFHFAGPNLCMQSEEALTHANKQMAKEDKWDEKDREQARLAIRHLQEALNDPAWVNRGADVVFKTANLGAEVVRAWTRQGIHKDLQLSAEETLSMQRAMRTILERQAAHTLEGGDLGRIEELITMGEIDRRSFFDRQAKAEQSKDSKRKSQTEKQSMIPPPQNAEISLFASSPKSSPSKKTSQSKRKSKMNLLEYTKHEYEARMRLPSDSELSYAHLSSASSTKLVKLLEVLSKVPLDEKVIIFSNLDNVLYETSAALDICWMPHFIYASGSSQERRNEVIEAFRSDQTLVRILLMKTNIGGRGLDLSCANHAIFLEPILDKSLRVQALKRTWRTGQRKPVHAMTLVIRETFEEDVLRISETASTYKLSEDPSMRAVVSNPTFISSQTLDVDCKIHTPIHLFPSHKGSNEDVSKGIIPLPTPPISPEKPSSVKMESDHPIDATYHVLQLHRPPTPSEQPLKKRKVVFA